MLSDINVTSQTALFAESITELACVNWKRIPHNVRISYGQLHSASLSQICQVKQMLLFLLAYYKATVASQFLSAYYKTTVASCREKAPACKILQAPNTY